jgi:16S rRNA G966 N2-methylase RsmD
MPILMFGSSLPTSGRLATKVYSGRRSRHCYAIKWFLVRRISGSGRIGLEPNSREMAAAAMNDAGENALSRLQNLSGYGCIAS